MFTRWRSFFFRAAAKRALSPLIFDMVGYYTLPLRPPERLVSIAVR